MSYLKNIQNISPSYYIACFLASLVVTLCMNLPIWIIGQFFSKDIPISTLFGVGCAVDQSIVLGNLVARNLVTCAVLWICFSYHKQKPLLNWKHASLQWIGFVFFASLLQYVLKGLYIRPELKEEELILLGNFYNYHLIAKARNILVLLFGGFLILRIVPREIREKRFPVLLVGALLFIIGFVIQQKLGFMVLDSLS